MSRANLSILGLYEADQNLFADLNLPDGIEDDLVIDNILMECAELELIYTDPVFMKFAIDKWSAKELPTWQRILSAATIDYDPIENYNRYEEYTGTQSGNREFNTEGSNNSFNVNNSKENYNENTSSNNTNKVAGYNSATMENSSGSEGANSTGGADNTQTHGITNSSGKREDSEHNNEITQHSAHLHGNIGVTSSQDMLTQELEIAPKLNVINYIVNSFKNRFCIIIY